MAERPVDILCFGEPLIGFYPPPGESMTADVPVIKTWGGDTSNTALAAAKLGLSSAYLTRVGDDVFGRSFIDLWKQTGVSTDLVQTDSEKKTGLYFVSFEGPRHIFTYYRADSAACRVTAGEAELAEAGNAGILHLSGISLGISEMAREAGFRLMRRAKENGVPISFDVNYRPALWSADLARAVIGYTIAEFADILEITDDEMEFLGWGKEPEDILERFPGPSFHIVKRGAAGAFLSGPGGRTRIPAFPVEVKDTVGAGDAFNAGFLAARLEGKTLHEAGIFAAAAAALVCTGTGPLEKQPSREEIGEFLAARR